MFVKSPHHVHNCKLVGFLGDEVHMGSINFSFLLL